MARTWGDRFSFDFDEGVLISGDRVEIATQQPMLIKSLLNLLTERDQMVDVMRPLELTKSAVRRSWYVDASKLKIAPITS